MQKGVLVNRTTDPLKKI